MKWFAIMVLALLAIGAFSAFEVVNISDNLNMSDALLQGNSNGHHLMTNAEWDSFFLNDSRSNSYDPNFYWTGTHVEFSEGATTGMIWNDGEAPTNISIPSTSGWYKTDNEWKFPNGASSDSSDPSARFLFRLNSYSGLLVRLDDFVNGRYVDAYYGPDNRFGVLAVQDAPQPPKLCNGPVPSDLLPYWALCPEGSQMFAFGDYCGTNIRIMQCSNGDAYNLVVAKDGAIVHVNMFSPIKPVVWPTGRLPDEIEEQPFTGIRIIGEPYPSNHTQLTSLCGQTEAVYRLKTDIFRADNNFRLYCANGIFLQVKTDSFGQITEVNDRGNVSDWLKLKWGS